MNKKVLVLIILILAVGVAIVGLSAYLNKPTKNLNPTTSGTVYQMRGKIKEVKVNSIVIEGTIGQTSQSSSNPVTKEFMVTSKTVLKNSQIVITDQQAKSGKSFHPETKFITGKFSDFIKGTNVTKIITNDNLLTADRVEASEIDYYTYDIQTTP